MRRSLFIPLFASVALMGCEDGPNQTFSPSPAGAGDFLNSGGTDAAVNPGKQDFDASYPGKSLQEICSADDKRARWAAMVNEKIVPPRLYAGIDMAGSDLWEGLTIEAAEQAPPKGNCQADNQGSGPCASGSGNCNFVSWGDNQEVSFSYNQGTHIVDQMVMSLGYTGRITFKDRSGAHTYTVAIGDVWRKDGQPYEIPWGQTSCSPQPCVSPRNTILTELYNAAMFTFGPDAGIPYPVSAESTDCGADRGCLVSSDGGDGNTYFGIRPLVIYIQTPTGTPQPVISTPKAMYNFFAKTEPYSNLSQVLKLDAIGPEAIGPVSATANCTQTVGLNFGDLLTNCVKVTGDAKADLLNYNKLIGGRQHDLENWTFNVVGVNQNFTKTQGPFDVVQDNDIPSMTDVATDWTFDVRAKGHPSNDYDADGSFAARGIGLVFIEWARLMLADAPRVLGTAGPAKTLGDPSCFPAASDLDANGVLIPGRILPAGCSGLEGLLIPSGDSATTTFPGVNAASIDPFPAYDPATSLSPGDPRIFVCNDIGTYNDCDGPGGGSMFDTLVTHVTRVLGGGDVNSVPSEYRDRRYYFRQFGIALVKYMRAYGAAPIATRDTTGLTPAIVKGTTIDLESLFFDNSFGNLFDKVEYIERGFMTSTGANSVPWDFEYGTDVKFGNQRYDNWYRRMDREEVGLYTAMTVAAPNAATKADPPGLQNNVNLTNLFGSPVLAGAFADYASAIADPAKDLNGTKPLYSYYPGVWGKTIFSMGHSPITLKDADKLPNVGAAKVTLPNYLDPYSAMLPYAPDSTMMCPNGGDLINGMCDTAQATGGPLTVLVPWTELQPGIGFSVPINGSRDKQVTTAQLDFTGVLETYLIDFEPWIDQVKPVCSYDHVCGTGFTCNPRGQCVDGTIKIDAIEASDFLGAVFPCQDPATGEILSVRQYTSALVIVDWLAAHPGAQAACDIVIKYSPYNNYIDFITSRVNGVKMAINAGQGLGRVVDVTLFDPAFAQQ